MPSKMITELIFFEYPRCLKCRLEALSPSTALRLRTSPTLAWAAPSRRIARRAKGGWGEGERVGREWLWLEGRVLQLQGGGDGGDPPEGSWGRTHIWGLSIFGGPDFFFFFFRMQGLALDAKRRFRGPGSKSHLPAIRARSKSRQVQRRQLGYSKRC